MQCSKILIKLVLYSSRMTCSYQISEEAASISSSPKSLAMSAAQRPGGGQAKICQFKLVLLGGRPIVFLMKPYFYPCEVPGAGRCHVTGGAQEPVLMKDDGLIGTSRNSITVNWSCSKLNNVYNLNWFNTWDQCHRKC